MGTCTDKELEFTIYLINKISEALNQPIEQVYKLLNSVDIIDGYMIKCYDVLHTLGEKYLVEDIIDLMHTRGVAL